MAVAPTLTQRAEQIKNDPRLPESEKFIRIRNFKIELIMNSRFREQTQVLTVEAAAKYAILPVKLSIGVGRFENEAGISTQTTPQWLEAIRTVPIVDWKSTEMTQSWKLPYPSQFAYCEKTQIVYIRLPQPVAGSTLIWFDDFDFEYPYTI